VKLSEWVHRLESADVGVRNNAASVLIGFGEPAAPASSALAKLLREDRNADVRRHAALALGQIGPKAKGATDALSQAAKADDDPSVRVWAARSLARVAPDRTEAAVESLIELTRKATGGFDRLNAIEGLGEIGRGARKAAPQLRDAATDSDPGVSQAARKALARIGAEP
jgi:HEAT repeat protein